MFATKHAFRPYQLEGIDRLIELTAKRGAAILADEPGLGKTIQVAGFINRTRPAGPVLIVCPASLRLNWRRELDSWLTWTPFSLDIVSYEAVAAGRTELSTLHPEYALLVFDEAHYLQLWTPPFDIVPQM